MPVPAGVLLTVSDSHYAALVDTIFNLDVRLNVLPNYLNVPLTSLPNWQKVFPNYLSDLPN